MLNLLETKAARLALILLISIVSFNSDSYSQPIGGFVKVKIDDGKDNEARYEIMVVHSDVIQPIDDSLIYRVWPIGGGTIKKLKASTNSKIIGDYTVLNYKLNYEGLIEPITNSCDFLFLYINENSQIDTLYLQSRLDIGSGGYYSSVDYLPPVIYHHPAQELSIGFLKQQELYHWPDLPIYRYSWAGYSPPKYDLKILPQTGNIVADKNTINTSFGLGINNTVQSFYMYRFTSSLYTYIIVDSTLTGHFNYDSINKNNSGFINVVGEVGKPFQFNFDYIDTDADSVIVECYYSNAHLGSNINYTTFKRSDTLSLSVSKLITEDIYKQLPQPVNFIVYPYKNQLTKPRYFSFNLVKDFSTGLSPQLTNTPKIQLYPNPTSGEVILANHENMVSLRFINILGQEVLKFTKPSNQLNIAELQNGVYIVEIIDNNKKVSYTRLIKE